MNKVTSYLKNVGKSVAYATVEVSTKKLIPEVAEFTETNADLFKSIYATTTNFKKSIRQGTLMAKRTQIYKDVNTGINNALEDIKTGNFYNKGRSDAAIDSVGESLAGGFGEFDDEFDFGDWDADDGSLDDFNDESPSSITKGDVVIADSVAKSSNLSAQLISKTVANTSSNIIKSNMATTNMMMAQNVELIAGIRTSIAGVHESINSVLKFSADVIAPHFNTQSQYFTDSMNVMRENNAILKEMLEMQRNVYKNEMEKANSKDQYGDVFSGGTLDLTEYSKAIFKNAKNYFDKSGMMSMLTSEMGGSSMLSQMLTNPLGMLVTGVVEKYMPRDFAKQVASFSKTLGNIFPVMITRLNKWKKDDRGGIFTLLGNLFGLNVDNKTSIDTSKYNKGAVPFDGITRKAIVDVIPEHLSKIESLLAGSSQRTYDFESGKWISAKDIKKKKDTEYENVIKNSFSELNDEIKTFMNTLESQKGLTAESKRNLEEDIFKMMKEFFEGDEIFSPKQIKKKSKEYGYKESELMEQFGEMLSNVPVSKLSSVYASAFDNRQKYSRTMSDAEAKGYDVLRKLFDNSKLDSHLIHDKTFKDEVIGTKAGSNLINIRDSYGMNTLDYLNKILINVSYIREFGGMGAGKRRGKGVTKFDTYAKGFNKDYTPKNISDLQNKQKGSDERFNRLNSDNNIDPEEAAAVAAHNVKLKSKFSDLDEDEFKNVGKWHKEKNHWMKEMEEIPGDTFTQKWTNAQSMKQKQVLIMGSISDIARKPASLLTGMIATAEKSIYNFLFQAESDEFDDETGKKIKGFFPAMLNKMRASWDKLTTTIDEKFITPLVQKYGLDEKWNNLKDKFKNSKPMDMLRNAKNNVKNALFKDLGGIYNYTKESVSDVMAPIIYDKNIVKTRTDALRKRYLKTNEKDLESLKNELSGYSKEEIEYLKENADPKLLKMIQDAGFNEGGAAIVEEGGSIQVSPGEIVNVTRPNKSGISEDRKKELDNALVELSDYAKKKSARTKSTFAKVKRLEGKAREVNSTAFSDAMTSAASEMKKDIVDPVKNTVTKFLGIKGDTEKEQEADIEKQRKNILGTVSNIFTEMKGEGASTASKAIIGGGLGLLSGIVGGPLIGAGIGAATSLIKNSTTINKAIFGEDIVDEDGNEVHKGGIISKQVQDTFKKFIPDMGKYGVTGAVASLITPFGPLAGAAIGAGVGFIKNSDTMNKMIFGEEITNEDGTTSKKGGVLTEERIAKIKKFLPKGILGAGAGMLLGPFGLLGNAALGAGVGMLTGTDEFKDLILGEDDGKGNRIGGIKGAMQEHFIEPLKTFGRNLKDDFFGFIKESMIDPLNDAITPITHEMAFWAKRIGIGFPKWLLNLGKDYIAQPILSKLNDYIGEPIAKGIKSIFGGLFSRAKGLISAPFRALGAIGNATRRHQLKAGRDAGGTAANRLAFANKQKMGNYKYRAFDEKVAENSDNKEYLEELTARTGMLAHGSEYFDKEIKKARKEVSRVVNDYYKLGWFKGKNKRSYNRIRQYINANDIESALSELSNIKESRTSGGRLDGEEANTAIARLTEANKSYQSLRDAKNKFGNINESENAEWMKQQFGENWNKMDAASLFEYSRRELSAAGGKSVGKADLFKDPTKLVTDGDREINKTLNKILNVITHGKEGTFVNDADNVAYDKSAKAGAAKFKSKVDLKKATIRKKFAKFAFAEGTIALLYSSDKLQDLVLSAKKQGITYDDDTVAKLAAMNLNNTQYGLLKSFPAVAFEKKEDILKALDYTRNNRATITKNRLFGAKAVRNNNLAMMNIAARDMNGISTGAIKPMTKEQLEAQNIKAEDKYTYISTNYGVRKYYKNDKGEMTLDATDAETKESLQKEKEEGSLKQAFMGKFSGISDSIHGIFNRNKTKDEEEKKEPWYKKLFNGDIGSKVKFGAAILATVTGIGALKTLWDSSKENNGVVYRIGSAVGDAISPLVTKAKEWVTNTGEYASEGGLAGFMNDHVYPNLFKGMNVIFGTILPTALTVFIKNIPALIKGALKGVAGLFGWVKDDNTYTLDPNATNAQGSPGSGGASIKSSGLPWLSEVLSDSQSVSASMDSITVDDNGNLRQSGYNTNSTEERGYRTGGKNANDPSLSEERQQYRSGGKNANNPTQSKKRQKYRTGGRRANAVDDFIAQGTSEENPNDQLTINGEGWYKKDNDGNLVPATINDYYNGEDIYSEDGSDHLVFDENMKTYTLGEDSEGYRKQKSTGQTITERAAYGAARGFATGKNSIISRLASHIRFKPRSTPIGMMGEVIKGGVKTVGGSPGVGAYARKSLETKTAANIATRQKKGANTIETLYGKAGKKSTAKTLYKATEDKVSPKKVVSKVTKEGKKANKKTITSIIEGIKAFLNKLFKSPNAAKKIAEAGEAAATKKKTIGDMAVKLIDDIMEVISKKLAKLSGTKLAGILSKIAARKVLTVAFIATDFIKGWDQAEAILTLMNPTPTQKLVAAVANALTQFAFAGFIDTAWLVDKLVNIVFPIFNINVDEYKEDVQNTKAEIDKYRKENHSNITDEQYLKENKSVTGKIWSLIKEPFTSDKSHDATKTMHTLGTIGPSTGVVTVAGKGSGKHNKDNSGFVSQLDSKYRSKKFNIPGDTEYQTIGDSGCAPATAANVLNLYRGKGSTMEDASKKALNYKDRNGGVTPDYFNDYLGKEGVGTYPTTNRKEIISGISHGNPTILLGNDPTNKANTPYGSASSHYVLATGLDGKGNVIIQDPESQRPNALYPAKDVIKQSQMGIVTGRGTRSTSRSRSVTRQVKSKLGKIGFGLGHKAQHQDLAKWSALSDSEIDAFIKKSNSRSPFTGKAINAAAKASGLDPRYILAHAAVESGWGLSEYGRKHHNYFGIGAFDSNPDNAKNYGNSGMTSGLVEGAKWIRKNYYDKGQKTVYTMRYNGGKHQYCTSTTWVTNIATIMEAMPANTSAKYHNAGTEDTGDPSSSQTASIFDKISNAMLSYYDDDLINLLWGESTSDEASGDTGVSGSAQKVIEVAKKEVGTKANPTKHQKYGKAYGMDGVDWCAIFCWWVFREAGCSKAFYGGKKSAYCPTILNYYKGKNQTVGLKDGKPGDLIFFDWGGDGVVDHIGIIEKKTSNGYKTIEGNTGYGQNVGGMVMNLDRKANIAAIARPKYESSSGSGTRYDSYKTNNYLDDDIFEIRRKTVGRNVAASTMNSLSGRGTNKKIKYLVDRFKDPDTNTSELSTNGIFDRATTKRNNFANPTDAFVGVNVSGRGSRSSVGINRKGTGGKSNGFSLPRLNSSGTSSIGSSSIGGTNNAINVSSTIKTGTEGLLTTIIEILKIIANNSEKLSEIVTLLSKALDLNLTDNDISGLSSNNAKVKNKIAKALKAQGSINGLGNSSMSATTESLAAAMYSIARA